MFKKLHFINISILLFILLQTAAFTHLTLGFPVWLISIVLIAVSGATVLSEKYFTAYEIADPKSIVINVIVWIFFSLAVIFAVISEYFLLFPRPSFRAVANLPALLSFLVTASPKLIAVFIISFTLQVGEITLKEVIYRLLFVLILFAGVVNKFLFLNAACLLFLLAELNALGSGKKTGQQFLLLAFGGVTLSIYGYLLPIFLVAILFLFRNSFRNIFSAIAILLAGAVISYFVIKNSTPTLGAPFWHGYSNWKWFIILPFAVYFGWITSNFEEVLLTGGLIWFAMDIISSGFVTGFTSAAPGAGLLLIYALHEYETDNVLGRIYPHRKPKTVIPGT